MTTGRGSARLGPRGHTTAMCVRDVTDPLTVLSCLRPCPAEAMEGYTVGPLVSCVRNDGPELVRPLER